NPFFSCGSVMEHPEAELFGFPNQLLGVAAFVFPLLIGVLFLAGPELPGWVMIGLNLGLALGVVVVMFLFYVSIYRIGVGCPWCIVVWTVTIPMFVAVTAHNVLSGALGTRAEANPFARVFAKENIALSVLWLLIIFACIVVQFWSVFSNLVSAALASDFSDSGRSRLFSAIRADHAGRGAPPPDGAPLRCGNEKCHGLRLGTGCGRYVELSPWILIRVRGSSAGSLPIRDRSLRISCRARRPSARSLPPARGRRRSFLVLSPW